MQKKTGKIKFHFHLKMTDSNFDYHKQYYGEELIDFWKNLKTGHDLFQKK